MNKIKLFIPFFMFSLLPFQGFAEDKKPRPFYEYKGDYRAKINDLKRHFSNSYGYQLLDLDVNWRPKEIDVMLKAFEQLPSSFYNMEGLKGLYRTAEISKKVGISPEEIPGATFPAFSTIFKAKEKQYNLYVERDFFRVEFYNSLFSMDFPEVINVIHHEMAHAFDIANSFPSVSKEWLEISGFKILNLPPLDVKKKSDFLFTFLNDSTKDRYAPVAIRHRETYSRLNPQEDFANAVAAYIHYPYFQYTNSERYNYLKRNVFKEKEYFSGTKDNFEIQVLKDLQSKISLSDWKGITNILTELGRGYYPEVAEKVIKFLMDFEGKLNEKSAVELAGASCYLMLPNALKFRRNLVIKKKVRVHEVLSKSKCKINGRDSFEKFFAKFPISNIYFYREQGRDYVQFMDPVLSLAFMRGFSTQYVWELSFTDGGGKSIAEGRAFFQKGGNGSIKLDLMKTAVGNYQIPIGTKVKLELRAKRNHPRNFRKVESVPAQIQFVLHPWFEYYPKKRPNINAVFPLGWLAGGKSPVSK